MTITTPANTSHNASSNHAPPSDGGFDFQPRTRVIFGAGSFGELGSLSQEFADGSVLLVTDPGLKEAGHCASAVAAVEATGRSVHVFDDVAPNPTTLDVDRCVKFASDKNIGLIIGLGGGSSMDCAKGANFLLTNGGRMQDYKGVGLATRSMLPMIAVPTTSGTGSEAQSFAVIADAETHMKMPCGDPKAACRIAVLDPLLTLTMPQSVAAATGIDAMTHAIESFVTKKRNTMAQMFARQAWQLLARSFRLVMDEPENVQARGDMQLGAHYAGAAIENSMLGAAHATANPLTAHFGTIHGHAVGIMLPHVIRWNAQDPEIAELYKDLAISAGWAGREASPEQAAEILASGFSQFVTTAGIPSTITQSVGDLTPDMINLMAEEATSQWTGLFNPRTMTQEGFREIYTNAS